VAWAICDAGDAERGAVHDGAAPVDGLLQ
jgi:hypothetical protein